MNAFLVVDSPGCMMFRVGDVPYKRGKIEVTAMEAVALFSPIKTQNGWTASHLHSFYGILRLGENKPSTSSPL